MAESEAWMLWHTNVRFHTMVQVLSKHPSIEGRMDTEQQVELAYTLWKFMAETEATISATLAEYKMLLENNLGPGSLQALDQGRKKAPRADR